MRTFNSHMSAVKYFQSELCSWCLRIIFDADRRPNMQSVSGSLILVFYVLGCCVTWNITAQAPPLRSSPWQGCNHTNKTTPSVSVLMIFGDVVICMCWGGPKYVGWLRSWLRCCVIVVHLRVRWPLYVHAFADQSFCMSDFGLTLHTRPYPNTWLQRSISGLGLAAWNTGFPQWDG